MKKLFFFIVLRLLSEYRRPAIYRRFYGVNIGVGNRYTGVVNFGSEPYLVEIGDNVTLALGATFITHDGGVSLFRDRYPGINVFGRIRIGSNVFVGANVTFMPGVTVGDNVVIGANSLVTRSVPSGVIAVGIPARPVKSLDEYLATSLKKAIFIPEGVVDKKDFVCQRI